MTEILSYSANVNASWGQGIDARITNPIGTAAWAVLNAPATAAEAMTRRWSIFASRDTTMVSGGEIGSSNGGILSSVITGPESRGGENAVMGIINDYASGAGGGNVAINATIGRFGDRPLWGIAVDAQEHTGTNPLEGLVPCELAYSAAGGDSHRKRGQLQIIAKTMPGQPAAVINAAITTTSIGDASHNVGWLVNGKYNEAVIDTRGAAIGSNVAFNLGQNQVIEVNGCQIWNDGNGTNFWKNGKFLMQIGDNGSIAFANVQRLSSPPVGALHLYVDSAGTLYAAP